MLSISSPCKIKGWILDAYPSNEGEITVWIISEANQRIRLVDDFHPKINVSLKKDNIDPLNWQTLQQSLCDKMEFCV